MFLLNLVKNQFRDHPILSLWYAGLFTFLTVIILQIWQLKPTTNGTALVRSVSPTLEPLIDDNLAHQNGLLLSKQNNSNVIYQVAVSGDINKSNPYSDADSLLDYLHLTSSSDLDYSAITELVSSSPSTFDILVQTYLSAEDSKLKHRLEDVIGFIEHPLKTRLAIQLANSQVQEERLVGYRWLMYSEEWYAPEVSMLLIEALSDPAAAELYPWIVSGMPSDILTKNEFKQFELQSQLSTFSYSSDIELAKAAILKTAEISSNHEIQDQLLDHIDYGEESIQILAIQILSRFQSVNDAIIVKLNTIMNDPYSSQKLRVQTVQTIIALENSGVVFP